MNSWTRVLQILMLALLAGVFLYAVHRCWRNFQTFAQSERTIREALNQALKTRKVDPITVVDLPTASRVFGVPEQLAFEQPLFRTDDITGRRPVGTLTGTFNRKTGEIRMNVEFFDGKRDRGLRSMLKPVP
jgi:hypothetical protein